MKSNQTKKYRKAAFCLAGMMLALPVLAQDNINEEELDDDILLLSPFEVEASSNVGYLATQTLAGTRIKTDLKDVGSAISVVTKEMLQDTGATDNASLLSYTTSTEVGGAQGNFTGVSDSSTYSENSTLLAPQSNTRVRGLTSADNTRDYLLTNIPWDSYNTERVDMQRGPNAILFGLGSPAGIINTSLNTANFNGNHGNVEVRFDKEGSRRASVDYNQVILEDELAIRFDALYNDTRYKQKPAYNLDKRVYVAARYAPHFLQSENVDTTIRVNYENGTISANRPRSLPPMDLVTPWFNELNQQGYDPVDAYTQPDDSQAGAAQRTNSYSYDQGNLNQGYQPWMTGAYGDAYSAPIWVYGSTDGSSTPFIYNPNNITKDGLAGWAANTVDGNVSGLPFSRDPQIVSYSTYAKNARLDGAYDGIYKDKVLQDPSFFDFYHNLIDGNNKEEHQDFETFNFNLSQNFFDNRFGYEVVYDKQDYTEWTQSFLNSWNTAIAVDIRSNLADGSANANFGRPYVFNRMNYNNTSNDVDRESYRFTATADLRASDFFEKGSLVERILGHHNFTALFSRDTKTTDSRSWKRATVSSGWSEFSGKNDFSQGDTDTNMVVYLGDSMLGQAFANQNLSGLSDLMLPTSGEVYTWDDTWNATDVAPTDWWNEGSNFQAENPDNYVGWTKKSVGVTVTSLENRDQMLKDARLVKNQVKSKAFIWQGYLFEGTVIPTFGYREDTSKSWSHSAYKNSNNRAIVDEDYVLANDPDATLSGNSKSWSVVVHAPKRITKYLPYGIQVSGFYNKSENFQPDASRVDIFGKHIDAPQGETRDYGFVVSALDNKVSFKVNWFKTTVTDATISGGMASAMWSIGANEVYATKYAEYTLHGEENGLQDWMWDWSQNMMNYKTWTPFSSEEDARAFGKYVSQLYLDNYPDEAFMNTWGIRSDLRDYFASNTSDGWNFSVTVPTGLAITSDMESTGVEFEVFLQPTDNWSITMNAAHVKARRYNLATSVQEWIEERDAVFQSDAGLVRLWGASSSTTIRDNWNSSVMSEYSLFKLQEDSNTPELRPWRLNIITNYNFTEGFLDGFSIGGGLRWQDRNIIGYKSHLNSETGHYVYDINQPYYGPTQTAFDMWMGYQMSLTDKIDWRIQLNVRNMFGKNKLIPISVEPDGSWAAARIAESMNWTITNTFSF